VILTSVEQGVGDVGTGTTTGTGVRVVGTGRGPIGAEVGGDGRGEIMIWTEATAVSIPVSVSPAVPSATLSLGANPDSAGLLSSGG
jgi:hypothetical protein